MQNFVPYEYCIKIRDIVVITNHYAILDYTIKFYIDWTSKNMSDSLLSDQNWWFYSLFLILGVRRCQGTNLELIWIAIKGDVNTLKMIGTYVNQMILLTSILIFCWTSIQKRVKIVLTSTQMAKSAIFARILVELKIVFKYR